MLGRMACPSSSVSWVQHARAPPSPFPPFFFAFLFSLFDHPVSVETLRLIADNDGGG